MVLYVYDSCELEKTLVKSNEDRVNQQNMNNTTLLVEGTENQTFHSFLSGRFLRAVSLFSRACIYCFKIIQLFFGQFTPS